jgi:type II secretory pathway pseudopilin PulG
MIVVSMAGIMAAIAVPNIVGTVRRADGERASLQVAASITSARDIAKTRSACVDFIQEPCGPGPGPFLLRTVIVACQGDDTTPPTLVSETRLPAGLTTLAMRPAGGISPVDVLHFDIEGALTSPFSTIQVDTAFDDVARAFTVFPVSGLVMARVKGAE